MLNADTGGRRYVEDLAGMLSEKKFRNVIIAEAVDAVSSDVFSLDSGFREEAINDYVDKRRLNDVLTNIGVLEVQKHNLAQQVKNISEEIEKTKSELEEEYGKVNINLADGTYEEIKEEEKDA